MVTLFQLRRCHSDCPNTTNPFAMADDTVSPFGPLLLELARMRKSNLTTAIDGVDKIIDLLSAAREQVAAGMQDVTRCRWRRAP